MNLYTPAGGLCETHVTWEDIEEDMQRELDTVATFGPNKTAKSIADGNGFNSMILLIDPDWQHKDKDLPKKFIVKIVTTLAMIRSMTEFLGKAGVIDPKLSAPEFLAGVEYMQKKIHNTEVTVYNHILKLPEGKMPHVKIYAMKNFSESNPVKGYIIMEYVENTRTIHIYENIKPQALKKVLRTKAILEAMSLKFTQEEREMFTEKIYSELFAHVLKKETLGGLLTVFGQFDGGKLADKAGRIEQVFPEHSDFVWADQLADELGMQRVLCHGDLWPLNVLWKPKGDDVDPVALIDFQNAHMGCPAIDFVRMFSTCLSGKDRREHWENLLEEFYGYLKEETEGMKMPYTLEQLKESYRQFMPIGAFLVVPVIGPFFEIICKNSDEEFKRKSMELIMEKTECLFEDVIYYHERNKNMKKAEKTG